MEFALVAPLLFLLAFGIVDFGRAMFYQNEITNAAREGARVAILASNPCNAVFGNAGGYGVPGGTCTAQGAGGPSVCSAIEGSANLIAHWSCGDTSPANTIPGTGKPGYAYVEVDQASSPTSTCPALGTGYATPRSSGYLLITVTIHYYFQPITPIISSFFPSTFYLSSSACARDEY